MSSGSRFMQYHYAFLVIRVFETFSQTAHDISDAFHETIAGGVVVDAIYSNMLRGLSANPRNGPLQYDDD
jgi:hypothetical protein